MNLTLVLSSASSAPHNDGETVHLAVGMIMGRNLQVEPRGMQEIGESRSSGELYRVCRFTLAGLDWNLEYIQPARLKVKSKQKRITNFGCCHHG